MLKLQSTRILFSLLTVAAMHAAAAPSGDFVGLDPKDLQAVPTPRNIVLKEAIVWSRSNKTELGVLPANYTANWLDADGHYYLADRPAVYMRTARGQYLLSKGGVFLPATPGKRPRFFLVQDSAVRRGATLSDAIAHDPQEPTVLPLVGALLDWASKGYVVLFSDVDDERVAESLSASFATR